MSIKITRLEYTLDCIKGFRIVEGNEQEALHIPITKVVFEGNHLYSIQGTPECISDIVSLLNHSLGQSELWGKLPEPDIDYPEND